MMLRGGGETGLPAVKTSATLHEHTLIQRGGGEQLPQALCPSAKENMILLHTPGVECPSVRCFAFCLYCVRYSFYFISPFRLFPSTPSGHILAVCMVSSSLPSAHVETGQKFQRMFHLGRSWPDKANILSVNAHFFSFQAAGLCRHHLAIPIPPPIPWCRFWSRRQMTSS